MSLSQQTSLEDTFEQQQQQQHETQQQNQKQHLIETQCQSCNKQLTKNEPNLLDCLHVYCKNCMDLMNNQCVPCQQLQHQQDQHQNINANDLLDDDNEFTLHDMLTNTLSFTHIKNDVNTIYCTSCKSKEISIARCIDCCNSLCSNCVTAHQYMKCFDNHKVVPFDNQSPKQQLQQQQQQQHVCKAHLTELLEFYCLTCDMPICSECLLSLHHLHVYERLHDAENKNIQELYSLVNEAKDKIDYCKTQSELLNSYFNDLQEQYETSRGYVDEIYHSYKALLEKKRDEFYHELEDKHSQKEVAIMVMTKAIDETISQINDLVKFTEKTLKSNNSTEILLLKKHIVNQLQTMFKQLPEAQSININLKIQTDKCRIEKVINDHFGYFVAGNQQDDMHINQFNSSNSNTTNTDDGTTSSSTNNLEPDWLINLQNNNNKNGFNCLLYNSNSNDPTTTTTTTTSSISPTQNWSNVMLLNEHHLTNATSSTNTSSKQHSPPSPANSDWLLNMVNLQKQQQSQQHLATLSSYQQDTFNNILLNNHHHSLNNSRSQTPGILQTYTASTTNGTSIDDYLSYDNSTCHLAQNLNRLTKLIVPNATTSTNTLSCISPPPQGTSSSSSQLDAQQNFMGNGNLNPPVRNGKMSHMQIRCKFGQLGPAKSQFNSPHGFCLGIDEEIIVADTNNHRIQLFDKSGEFKYQFGIPGREEGQLWYPRKVTVMRNSGKFVVCDRGNERSRMQIFNKNGHFIKKIAIRYIDIVAGLAITSQGHIVAVDSVSPTVFCISEAGDLLKWFDCSDHMREPSDIAVSGREYFVCDFKGHCVVVFNEDGQFMRRIGGENITNFPNGIDVSDAGDVLVGDSHGNRFHVAVFSRDGNLLSEFECPYVKVSRCCGLKITSEGYVVTLAKNNHHVLVLNTLYVS